MKIIMANIFGDNKAFGPVAAVSNLSKMKDAMEVVTNDTIVVIQSILGPTKVKEYLEYHNMTAHVNGIFWKIDVTNKGVFIAVELRNEPLSPA